MEKKKKQVWATNDTSSSRCYHLRCHLFCHVICHFIAKNLNLQQESKNLKRVMVRDGICGESAHGLKNGCSRFKIILCCFLPNISPSTKFPPNRTKNTEVENFHYWSVLVGRAGRSKKIRSHFKHSESVQRLTNDLCTKFKPNRMKIGQVSPSWKFLPKIEIWLVGPVCMG